MNYLDFETFKAQVSHASEWRSYLKRWMYHNQAIEIIKTLGITRPESVLEIGTLGAAIVIGSDTMDMENNEWIMAGYKPKIWHDARNIPWPFEDGQYDLVVALRVFHHLAPMQEKCLLEAKRIAKYILIVCPEKEIVGVGITREQFKKWNGAPSSQEGDIPEGWGRIYLFKGNQE